MPFTYTIDEERGFIRVDARGLLVPRMLIACMEEYRTDPAFRADLNTLFVISGAIDIQFGEYATPGTEEIFIEQARRNVREARGDATYRRACAGGSQEEQAFFAMSFEIVNPGMTLRLFDTAGQALRWLRQGDLR